MRTVPAALPGCFTNTTQASGALQLLASATAACEVAGSSVGMAAAISLAARAESVGSASLAGPDNVVVLDAIKPGTRAAVTMPAVSSAPAIVMIAPPMKPWFRASWPGAP